MHSKCFGRVLNISITDRSSFRTFFHRASIWLIGSNGIHKAVSMSFDPIWFCECRSVFTSYLFEVTNAYIISSEQELCNLFQAKWKLWEKWLQGLFSISNAVLFFLNLLELNTLLCAISKAKLLKFKVSYVFSSANNVSINHKPIFFKYHFKSLQYFDAVDQVQKFWELQRQCYRISYNC